MTKVVKRVVGDTLYQKRMEYNLSQERMSEVCSLSTRQYGDIENCKRLPNCTHLIEIALRCDIDLNALAAKVKAAYELSQKNLTD